MIDPITALRDVRASLREEILPELQTARSRALLGASLGIIDTVIKRIRIDEEPARRTVEEIGPQLTAWGEELRDSSPRAAEALDAAAAELGREPDPIAARLVAIGAAERAIEAAYADLAAEPRQRFLERVRPLVRRDIKRQEGAET